MWRHTFRAGATVVWQYLVNSEGDSSTVLSSSTVHILIMSYSTHTHTY